VVEEVRVARRLRAGPAAAGVLPVAVGVAVVDVAVVDHGGGTCWGLGCIGGRGRGGARAGPLPDRPGPVGGGPLPAALPVAVGVGVAGPGHEPGGVVDVANARMADALERCGVPVLGRVVPPYYSVDAEVLRGRMCSCLELFGTVNA